MVYPVVRYHFYAIMNRMAHLTAKSSIIRLTIFNITVFFSAYLKENIYFYVEQTDLQLQCMYWKYRNEPILSKILQ